MKRVLLVVVALLAAAPTGCSAAPHEPPEQPVKMRVALTQGRVDEVRRTVQVAMNNDGPSRITVVRVEVLAPSFKGVGPVPVDAPLPVGGLRVDVPVPYGTGICDGVEIKPRSAASQVALGVRTEDGRIHDLRLPLPDPDPMLDKLLAIDCRQAYLDRQVTLTFGPWSRLPGGRVAGAVLVKRAGFHGTVTLQEFAGSILLQVRPTPLRERTPKPYGVLKPGVNELRIPIVVDGDRCTPHVLAEIKKPYVFPAFVVLDGGEPLYTELKVTDAERAAFAPVIEACAARRTPV
jgi:hypothetical protein